MGMNDNRADGSFGENANKTTIFAVRTTIGQEKSVLTIIFNKLRVMNPFPDLKAIMISEQLRGYIFIEAIHKREVMSTIAGVPHVKGKVVGSIKLEDIQHVIQPRRVTEVLEEGDKVEIVSGIFAGQTAKVVRMPKEGAREEVTLRLLGSDSDISIKIHGDFLKLLEKGEKRKERYEFKPVEPDVVPLAADGSVEIPIIPIGGAPTNSAEITEDAFDFGEEPDEGEGMDVNSELSDKDKRKERKKVIVDEDEDEDDEWSKFSF
jgi:transcriptional antiterminator NusG